jgi:hypothetical protein
MLYVHARSIVVTNQVKTKVAGAISVHAGYDLANQQVLSVTCLLQLNTNQERSPPRKLTNHRVL